MSEEDSSNAAIAEPNGEERAAKRLKTEETETPAVEAAVENKTEVNGTQNGHSEPQQRDRNDNRGANLAPVKEEYLIDLSTLKQAPEPMDDDTAEGRGAAHHGDDRDRDHRGDGGQGNNKKGKKKNKGQNTERSFGKFDDELPLCNSRAFTSEFSPRECRFGDRCRLCHDLRKYLKEGRRDDLTTWGGVCPVYEQHGTCPTGWKCRFVRSHMKEIEHEDGRKELTLLVDETKAKKQEEATEEAKEGNDEPTYDMFNVVPMGPKIELNRKRTDFKRTETYIKWLDGEARNNHDLHHRDKDASEDTVKDLRAQFIEPPFKPSEKRRLYFGPETPTLAPLTTQGNLPFRRLCVELGAELTYSEMALSMPLLQGTKADWTLMKAHKTEVQPPTVKIPVFDNSYDHSRDMRFGAQISGSAVWVVTKAADILNRLCPQLRVIDLNCGCPIDMVFKSGGGSALLESQGKLERMIRGMNAVSGEVPITAKIRMGVKNNRPTAPSVIERLAFGAKEHRDRLGAPGCAAITLHGRSREQRYTKLADWSYIGDCAALIKSYNDKKAALTDTAAEPDASTLPNSKSGKMYFLGNGDCFSHIDYYNHIENAKVDSVMIGRGALIKPWLFEEIQKGQYLDKSASERLTYIEKFTRYGLEAWGSDELGIGFTRRFLLEWLSFSCRYIPIGVLEHLPPSINQRPPAYHGRNDLETLMASTNFKDWIKLTEMYLGPVHPGFQFQPKHKSNAYEAEG